MVKQAFLRTVLPMSSDVKLEDRFRSRIRVVAVHRDVSRHSMARIALDELGCQAEEAAGGAAALEMCSRQRPDLVTIDLGAVGWERYDTCANLRQRWPDLPILMLIDDDDPRSIKRAHDAGATDVILSPVNWALFQHRISNMLAASHTVVTLRNAQRQAEQASRTKSAFLANVSHEIRTPMTAVLGYLDVLVEEGALRDATNDAVVAVERIRSNAHALLHLIDEILDLGRIEQGKLRVELGSCSPIRTAEAVVGLVRYQAESRGLYLRLDAAPDVPELVRTDRHRLRQILLNLVSNALKFTREGGVEVRLEARRPTATDCLLIASVIDTGVGIPEDEQVEIFGEFMQGTNRSAEWGGVGLGLSIVKSVVSALGGSIGVQSRIGEGSVFRVELPVTCESDADTPLPTLGGQVDSLSQLGAVGLRILLVEDGVDNQRLVSRILTRAGASVEISGDGLDAIRRVLEAVRAENPFDLILMDMQMPVMDGYEATRRLRDAGLGVPIVALTAQAMTGDREACIAAGCDDYLSKPIDRRALVAKVTDLVDKTAT